MTVEDVFCIHRQIQDELNTIFNPPHHYLNYKLTDERKRKIIQSVIDSNVDIKKFFLANHSLQRQFFLDTISYDRDKCFSLYYSWDDFLTKKRPEFFRRIITEYKKGIKIDLDDRDKFLEIVPITDYLFFSALYPKVLELLESLDPDWVKFHLPDYENPMDYVRRIIRGNLILRNMRNFMKIRNKILSVLINKGEG